MPATVALYRTIQAAELRDLRSIRAFRLGPNSVEGKYFWTNRQDAEWFARELDSRLDTRPSWIVEVRVAPGTEARLGRQFADGRNFRYVDEDQLAWFNDAVMELVLPSASYQGRADV